MDRMNFNERKGTLQAHLCRKLNNAQVRDSRTVCDCEIKIIRLWEEKALPELVADILFSLYFHLYFHLY